MGVVLAEGFGEELPIRGRPFHMTHKAHLDPSPGLSNGSGAMVRETFSKRLAECGEEQKILSLNIIPWYLPYASAKSQPAKHRLSNPIKLRRSCRHQAMNNVE